MTDQRSLLRGGTLVTGTVERSSDIAIEDGRIVAIGEHLDGYEGTEIDATGLLVLPGAIDVHTHFETLIGSEVTADDFESGSRAAAAGGITTFVNFAFQDHGHGLRDAVDRESAKADGECHIDYSFHVGVTDVGVDGVLQELDGLAADGLTSVKMFTTIPGMELNGRETLALLNAAAHAGCIVAVHAEDGPLVEYLTQSLLESGRSGVEWLPAARPVEAEALAITRVSEYARAVGCPVYIVHLSSAAGLDAVRTARARGGQVYIETRPAYLYMDTSRYQLGEREGNKYVTWPPLREKADQEALWRALDVGEIQTYATDHTTWSTQQKLAEELTFDDIPGGVANVQTSIGMLFNEGVQRGRLSLSQMVNVVSTNPAKLFGMWPRKGAIAVGSDADLVLIDPRRSFTVTAPHMESRSDFDPYEGYEATGWPVMTISRGEVIVRDGEVLSSPGRGELIRRRRFQGL
jgi:dihydropyrimidinase